MARRCLPVRLLENLPRRRDVSAEARSNCRLGGPCMRAARMHGRCFWYQFQIPFPGAHI